MNPITRRHLLRTTALVPVAGLAACSGLAGIVAVAPQVVADVAAIANALRLILPTIEGLLNLSASVKSTIAGIVDEISSIAAQIGSATASGATTLVAQLGGAIGTITNLISGSGLGGIISTVLSDALALLPAIEAGVGIVTPTAPATARRFAAAITPDQARADLQLILAGGRPARR